MLIVNITYHANTRQMELVSLSSGNKDDGIATTGDNIETRLQFTFDDPEHTLDGFGKRVEFAVKLVDSDNHAYQPYILLDENDGVLLPHTILSNVKCSVLPIQLAFSRQVDGEKEEFYSLNILNLAVNKAIDATSDIPIEHDPSVTDAIYDVSYDDSSATFTFTQIDGTIITVSLTDLSEEHFEVQSYADLESLTEAESGDTATTLDDGFWYKLYIRYGTRTWYLMAGAVNINGQSTGTPTFYAPYLSGDSGEYLESRGVNQSPVWVAKVTAITSESDSLPTVTAVKNYVDAETTRATGVEDSLANHLSEEASERQTADTTLQNNIDALRTQTQTALNSKRDKITAPHTSNPVVYTQSYDAESTSYTEGLYDLTDNTTGGTIPVRNSSGKLTSNGTADGDTDNIVSTKGYTDTKDALKIDKANIVTGDWQTTSDNTHVPSELLTRTKINAVQNNLDTHTTDTSNPHSVTKAQVGLGSVENQAMDNAPTENSVKYVTSGGVYTAIQTVQTDIDTHEADTDNPHSVTKSQVGLGNCDNTSDADKPVSTAQQTALNGKLDDTQLVTAWSSTVSNDNIPSEKLTKDTLDTKVDKTTTVNGHALSGNVTVTKGDVGLGNCDNTSDMNKPVSTAQQTALNGKLDDSQLVNTFTGHISDDTYIPSAKLVDTSLATKVDKTFDSTLFDGASFPSSNVTDSSVSIRFTTKNTNNNNTGTLDVALPVASGGTNGRAGIATKAQIDQIEQNRQDIALLSGKSSRYAINVNLSGMTESQIQTTLTSAWRTASGQSTGDPNEYTTLVNLWNNHEYTWLDVGGTESWADRGISTVSTATNSSLGVVMGTPDPQDDSSNGCIFVESDGTMNVLGWDDVTTAISNNASDISSLQSGKVDKLTNSPAGTYPKVTVNAQGQVTSGTTLSASDIPALDWSKITSGVPIVTSWSATTLDTNIPSEKLTKTALDNKVDKLTTSPAGSGYTKVTVNAQGQVTGHSSLAESDIPSLSISKTTGLQTALDNKLDDTQLKTAWSSTVSDTNIPSEKLTKDTLDTKLDKVTHTTGTYLYANGTTQAQIPVSTGAYANNVIRRDANSQITVVETPTATTHATSKKYVDDADATKVTGPSSATSNNVVLFDGTTGKLVKDSGKTLGSSIPAPTSSDKDKALIVVQNGNNYVYDFGEAGKVDDVKVNGTSVVSNKVASVTVPTKVSELQNDTGFITGLGFNDLSSHPTTIAGYGITDAKISNGVITLGSSSMTPLTSHQSIKTVNGNTLTGTGNVSVGTVTNIATGVGLTGGPVTSSGTIKAKLKSETNATYDSETITNTSGRQYAVVPDKTNGYLSVNVPWQNNCVMQYEITTANEYPILASYNTGSTSPNTYAIKNSSITINPSTGKITAPHFYNSSTSSSLDFIVGSIISLTEVD